MSEAYQNGADPTPPGWLAQPPLPPEDAQADAEPTADPQVEEIAAEIESTRAHMTQTVDAIGERLDPSHIVHGATDAVRQATVGKVEQKMQQVSEGMGNAVASAGEFVGEAGATAQETGAGVVDMIRRNPVPAALIGLGVGMLWMNRSNGSSYRPSVRTGSSLRSGSGMRSWSTGSNGGNGNGGNASYGSGYASGGTGYGGGAGYGGGSGSGLGSTVGDALDTARSTASEIPDRVGYAARDFAGTAAEVPDQMQDAARQVVDRASSTLDENPLGVAVAALAVGAAVGLVLPSTPAEQRILGPAAQTVAQRAGEAVSAPLQQMEQQATESIGQ